MPTLDRGFKTWAERVSGAVRRELGHAPHDPLPPEELAGYLGVRLWTPLDVPGLPSDVIDQLLKHDPWGWSAVTQVVNGSATVIYNPRHSPGRRASNITHELAHLLLEHDTSRVILSPDGDVAMRTFDAKQEEEASWLSGCLLLPRVALLRGHRTGKSNAAIADDHGVTEVLVAYRSRITGVEAQVRQAGRRR
jgi:hypothetical protein